MTVTIFFPTYRNAAVFRFCLESVLNQTFRDLEVFVYDNGLSDGYSEIRDLVRAIGDPRVTYRANNKNVGALQNYTQIFHHSATVDQAVILAADSGLRADAIDLMLRCREERSAAWIRPRAASFSLNNLDVAKRALVQGERDEEPEIRVSSSAEVLSQFFGDANLDGEFDRASWAGSLIDGSIWRMADIRSVPFRWHGSEQYVTMRLLLSEFTVAFVEADLEVAIVGATRYGTERPAGDFTRLETIQATDLILRNHLPFGAQIVSDALRHQRRAILRFLSLRRGHRLVAVSLLAATVVRAAIAAFRGRFL